jgi:hypothetical protein
MYVTDIDDIVILAPVYVPWVTLKTFRGCMVPMSRIISIGVEAEITGVLLPLLLFSDMEVMFMAKAMTRSEGESPTLICTGVLWGAGGAGVVWLLLVLLLPPQATSAKSASTITLTAIYRETLSNTAC